MDILLLLLAGSVTALATGLGAIPVFLLGDRTERLRQALWGFAVGTMGVASVVGLLLPALNEGDVVSAATGLAVGIVFVAVAHRLIDSWSVEEDGPRGAGMRSSVLVFSVLFVHSGPEGLAIGTAYASQITGLSLFVILAIALQNVPEGTSIAIPMQSAGFGRSKQFWAAVGTSAPQPVAAVAAFGAVEWVDGLLAISFAFAAGAMLALIAVELLPQAASGPRWRGALAGTLAGAALMLGLSALLGV